MTTIDGPTDRVISPIVVGVREPPWEPAPKIAIVVLGVIMLPELRIRVWPFATTVVGTEGMDVIVWPPITMEEPPMLT